MKKSFWIYTFIGVGVAYSLASSFQTRLTVHPYATWMAGASMMTWVLYAWDKRCAELRVLLGNWRVPELTLHLMALLGGFPGAWVARSMFNHKLNVKRHPEIVTILAASTILHLLLTVRLVLGPPIQLWPPANWLNF